MKSSYNKDNMDIGVKTAGNETVSDDSVINSARAELARAELASSISESQDSDKAGTAAANTAISKTSTINTVKLNNTAVNSAASSKTPVRKKPKDSIGDLIADKIVRIVRGLKRKFAECKTAIGKLVGNTAHSSARTSTRNTRSGDLSVRYTGRAADKKNSVKIIGGATVGKAAVGTGSIRPAKPNIARQARTNTTGIRVTSPTVVISVVLLTVIITVSVVGVSQRKTEAVLLSGGTGYYGADVTRIEAPTFNAVETYDDTYADESLPESVTSAVNDSLELILPAVTTAALLVDTTEDLLSIAADTTSYADMTDALPDTIPETLAMPETITETAAEIIPETVTETTTVKLPETTAETITETQPETTPTPQDTNSLPSEVNSAPTAAGDRLVDKYNIEYDIVTPTVSVTDEEIQLTAAIIQLEVMGNGSELEHFDDTTLKYWEMLAVAMCVRNRAESPHFPDTIKEVILDSVTIDGQTYYQFSPATVLDTCTPTEEALTAAREVLCDGVTVLADNYYYFCASSIEKRFEENNSYSLLKTDTGYAKVRGDTTTFYAGFYND